MALNNYGIGINVSAKDAASATLASVGGALTKVTDNAKAAATQLEQVAKGATAALSAAATASAKVSAMPVAKGGTQAVSADSLLAGSRNSRGQAPPHANASPDFDPQAARKSMDQSERAQGQERNAKGQFVAKPVGANDILSLETLREVKGRLSEIGEYFKKFGETVFSIFEAGADAATAFGKGIAEVSTLVPEAQFKVEDMRKSVLAMSSQFGGKMEDQIRAMYQGISAGAADASSSTALLTQANKLAIGGVTDVKTAVDGLTNVLNAYGQSYTKDNLQGLSDAFFVGLSKGKTTAAELSATLGEVAPSAASVGFAMTDLIAAISAITTKGIGTAQAVTGIKAALAVISHPAKEATEEAQRLGIQFSEAAIRAKGFPAFLESITKNAKFNADSMTKLFGGSIEAKNAMLALAGGGGAFSDTLAAMKGRLGATDAAFDTMSKSPAFQGQLFEGLKEQALVLIGEGIMPIKGALLLVANTILKAFVGAPPVFQKLVVWAGAIAGALATLLGGAFGTAAAITGLVLAGKALLIGMAAAAAVVAVLVAALVPLIAMGATLYLVWTRNVGGIQEILTSWFEKTKLAVEGISQLFESGRLSGAVQQELSQKGSEGVKGFVITVFMWFSRIKNFFANIGSAFTSGLDKLAPLFKDIMAALKGVFDNLIPISKTGSTAKDSFMAFGNAGLVVGKILVSVVGWIARGILHMINFVRGAIEIWDGFSKPLSAAWEAAGELGEALGELFAIFSTGDQTTASSTDGWRTFGQVIGGLATAGIMILTDSIRVLGGIFEWLGGIIGAVKMFFQGFLNSIVLGVQFVGAVLTGNWANAWKLMQDIVQNAVATIMGTILKLIGGAAGMADSLAKIFGGKLDLKASVGKVADNFKLPTLDKGIGDSQHAAAPANASPPGPPAASTAPAPALPSAASTSNPNQSAAAAQAQGVNTTNSQLAQLAQSQQSQPPITVQVKNTTVLDGQVIADATTNHQQQQAGRAFQPLPSPT